MDTEQSMTRGMNVRHERKCKMDRQEEVAHTPAQDLLWKSDHVEGVPSKRAESTASYRLRVFMRWVEKSQEGHWAGQFLSGLLTLLR
jgi:hypothetical protein